MADNKRKRGRADRARVSGTERYEVAYFARKHRMSAAAVRRLIKRVGNSRKKLEAAVAKMKSKGRRRTKRRRKRR